MAYQKRKDMELFSKADILLEGEEIEKEHDGNKYTIKKMVMKDYRNERGYSHISIEFSVECDGKTVVSEYQYDTGTPPTGFTIEDNVIPRIRGSSGSKMVSLGKDSIGLSVCQIVAPPNVVELSETWFDYIVGCFNDD